jgi:nucleotide-binding universal stress UspA family protein
LTSQHTILIRSVVEMAPWGSSSAVATEVYEQLESQLKPKLDHLVQRFAAHGVIATPTLHVAHNTADDLIDAAQRQQADLIMLGSIGKSTWQRLLLGSVTMRILHHAPCSVWVEHLQNRS